MVLTSCSYNRYAEIPFENVNSSTITSIPVETFVSSTTINNFFSEQNFNKHEYNGRVILKTDFFSFILSCQKDDESKLTDTQYQNIEYLAKNMDSADRAIMKLLSAGLETVAEENAPTYYAEIFGVYDLEEKTYMIRGYHIMGSSFIYEIWCTDGNTIEYVGDFVSTKYEWMYPIKDGKPVIVTYEFTVRGFDYSKSPLIAANVYTIESSMLTEYKLENDKQFFWLYKSKSEGIPEGNELYILDAIEDGYIFAPEDVTELALKGELNQEIGWDNGKIKIISGYGA